MSTMEEELRAALDAVRSAVLRARGRPAASEMSDAEDDEEEGGFAMDEVPLDEEADRAEGGASRPTPFEPRDMLDAAALGALRTLRSLDPSHASELLRRPGIRISRDESRALIRAVHIGPAPPPGPATSSALLGLALDRSLPWHAREEALICLRQDRTPTSGLGAAAGGAALGGFGWNAVIGLAEGGETGRDDAAVRSAALGVIVSHNHAWAVRRLAAITENEARRPLPGWWDGERQLQLARASLGDPSAFATAVVRRYDPVAEQRREAEAALRLASERLGGVAEVARRILIEDEVTDEDGEVPALGSDPGRTWEFLAERHWNECVVRWAREELARCKHSAGGEDGGGNATGTQGRERHRASWIVSIELPAFGWVGGRAQRASALATRRMN